MRNNETVRSILEKLQGGAGWINKNAAEQNEQS
jgi:hypothetical protein